MNLRKGDGDGVDDGEHPEGILNRQGMIGYSTGTTSNGILSFRITSRPLLQHSIPRRPLYMEYSPAMITRALKKKKCCSYDCNFLPLLSYIIIHDRYISASYIPCTISRPSRWASSTNADINPSHFLAQRTSSPILLIGTNGHFSRDWWCETAL